jgi:predicted DCC family thiol-disulfide oxidoreductase YuxK
MSAVPDAIVLFDGVCNLCSRSVTFIIEHERESTLRFASVQSRAGAQLMRRHGLDPANITTFALILDNVAYTRSDAALRIARRLRGPWRLLTALRIVPRPVRDFAYDLVARNRYRWFGRRESCMVPTPQFKARFLDP